MFTRNLFFVLCCSVLCSCASHARWYAKETTCPIPSSDIPFNKEAGRGDSLYVMLHSESGKEWLFGVDTGSPVTILDKSLEPELGKRLQTKTITSGYYGNVSMGVYQPPAIYLGGTRLVIDGPIWTEDLSGMSRSHHMMGILGMDCLHHYCLQLDFQSRKLRFLDPGNPDEGNLGRAYPLTLSQAGVTVHQNLLGVKGEDSGIDTGDYLDGALAPSLIHRWLHEQQDTFADGWKTASQSPVFRLRKGMFEDVSYPDLIVRANRRCNLIGLRFLARHLVTFNFPRQTMHLKRMGLLPLEGDVWRTQPNPQGGANGRQPFSSEANQTPQPAASRRSP